MWRKCRFANHVIFTRVVSIQGQNALSLATYSGDIDTCNAILNRVDFETFNATGLLSPLCVAALQGNLDMAQIYLTLETPNQNRLDCPSESIHGVCPMQLAQYKGDINMMDLLRPTHQSHLTKTSSIHWTNSSNIDQKIWKNSFHFWLIVKLVKLRNIVNDERKNVDSFFCLSLWSNNISIGILIDHTTSVYWMRAQLY